MTLQLPLRQGKPNIAKGFFLQFTKEQPALPYQKR
jgi:hypothetical protein